MKRFWAWVRKCLGLIDDRQLVARYLQETQLALKERDRQARRVLELLSLTSVTLVVTGILDPVEPNGMRGRYYQSVSFSIRAHEKNAASFVMHARLRDVFAFVMCDEQRVRVSRIVFGSQVHLGPFASTERIEPGYRIQADCESSVPEVATF